MSVSRVALGFAILFWTSWTAADLFISVCFRSRRFPAGHPSRVFRGHVRQLFFRRRMFLAGYKSGASINSRPISAVTPDSQVGCCGLNAKNQRDVSMCSQAVVAASAGVPFSCAVRSDGQLVCSGGNRFGQCDVPTGLGAVVAVSAGCEHTCAVRSGGQLDCFGLNDHGQCDVQTGLGAVVAPVASTLVQ